MLFFLFSNQLQASDFRIVSLDPAATEILFSLGLGKQLVGKTNYCNFPKEAEHIPSIGDYNNPKLEKILNLKPSHIIAFKSGRAQLKKGLEKKGIKLISFEANALKDYPVVLKSLAKEFNINVSNQLNTWNTQLHKIKTHNWFHKTVLLVVSKSPIIVSGSPSFLSEAFALCAKINLIKKPGWPQLSREKLLLLKPNFIIDLEIGESRNYSIKSLTKSAKWLSIRSDAILRLGPRLPAKLFEVCKKIDRL